MDTLPNELLSGVLGLLSAHDLTQIGLACKRLNKVATPLLWTNIDLHTEGYHAKDYKFKGLPPVTCPSQRFYHCSGSKYTRRFEFPTLEVDQAQGLFTMLQQYQSDGNDRLSNICARILSVCTMVIPTWRAGRHFEPGIAPRGLQIWEIFPLLTNLEMLELYADHVQSPEQEVFLPDITAPSLPKLRYAKLFGHFPPTFAAWILRSAATLQRLELGMVDRLLSGSDSVGDASRFRPLPEENLLLNPSLEDTNLDQTSDYGSLDGEKLIPRPLGEFLPANISGSDGSQADCTLPHLRHLYLCQPSTSKFADEDPAYSWSTRADKACLTDWRQLLLAANQTLEVLVLEQRPGWEGDQDDVIQFFMIDNEEGVGSLNLVSMMEDLLNISGIFPMLRKVYLYGISMGAYPAWERKEAGAEIDADRVPGRRLLKRFQQLGIECEARLGIWCNFDVSPDRTWWNAWTCWEDVEEGDCDDEGGGRDRPYTWNTVLARV